MLRARGTGGRGRCAGKVTGALRAHVEATSPLAEAAKAHALGETGRTAGRIALTVEGTVKSPIAAQARRAVFDGGDTTVIDRHVRPDCIQHNPLAPDGLEAMKAFGAAMRLRFPGAECGVLRVLSEGDLMLLHSRGVLVPGPPGMAVFDIFRFQGGKIAERWDILQEVPATTANGNDMFATLGPPQTGAPEQRWFTAYGKKFVTAFVDRLRLRVRKGPAAVDTCVGPECHQNDPNFPGGVAGMKAGAGAYFERFPQLSGAPKRRRG